VVLDLSGAAAATLPLDKLTIPTAAKNPNQRKKNIN